MGEWTNLHSVVKGGVGMIFVQELEIHANCYLHYFFNLPYFSKPFSLPNMHINYLFIMTISHITTQIFNKICIFAFSLTFSSRHNISHMLVSQQVFNDYMYYIELDFSHI